MTFALKRSKNLQNSQLNFYFGALVIYAHIY
eukprot:UN21564